VRRGFGDQERVTNYGEKEQLARDVADDHAKAGQLGALVCRRVVYEPWVQMPDRETMGRLRGASDAR